MEVLEAIKSGQLEADQFLREFKEDADKRKLLLMTDQEAYFQFLEDATLKMAKEMKRRAGAAPEAVPVSPRR